MHFSLQIVQLLKARLHSKSASKIKLNKLDII